MSEHTPLTEAESEVERLCEVMHDAYEAAAAKAGWETQQRSRVPWADVPEANKATMRAAVRALLDSPVLAAVVREARAAELREAADEAFGMDYPSSQDPAHWGIWLRHRADRIAVDAPEPCGCGPDEPEEACPQHGRPCGEPDCPILGSPHGEHTVDAPEGGA